MLPAHKFPSSLCNEKCCFVRFSRWSTTSTENSSPTFSFLMRRCASSIYGKQFACILISIDLTHYSLSHASFQMEEVQTNWKLILLTDCQWVIMINNYNDSVWVPSIVTENIVSRLPRVATLKSLLWLSDERAKLFSSHSVPLQRLPCVSLLSFGPWFRVYSDSIHTERSLSIREDT